MKAKITELAGGEKPPAGAVAVVPDELTCVYVGVDE
jgi:hypothetical protein